MTSVGLNAHVVNEREDYDPLKGDKGYRAFQGTELAMRGIKADLRLTRPDLSVSVESVDEPVWQCTIQSSDPLDGGQALEVTTWELLSNDVNKSIYEHPNTFRAVPSNVDAIRKGIADNKSTAEIIATFTGTVTDYDVHLLLLLKKGVTDCISSQYVLRRTQTVSSAYQVKVGFSGIDAIWPLNYFGSPLAIANGDAPPAAILFSVDNIPSPDVPPPVGSVQLYRAGWLKKSPTVQQVAANKFQMHQEWWLSVSAYFLYANAV